ncbi:CDP-glycerol glycerophosphotransferase family protein [Paenibacillus xylanexedens]|uniref:CDP-glycerol glycerophosphotransferase family protein n=1 Tax=Paenibacillus xylanexedens TaxID=528191 RepID=UPI0016431B31|nr:CDP-glycerol glycerophosphotransferase family protein [Paenibacillus xylanexedens]
MEDIKQNILTEKKYKFGINKFNIQTWEDFNNFKSDKSVFIFGAGYGADYYFQNYPNSIVGIIDNDEAKHGHQIDFFVDKISLDKCKEKKVLNVSVLKQYKEDDLVILIANLNAAEQIAEQLESLGISNYFSLLAMETVKRNSFVLAKEQIVNHCFLKKCTDKIEPNKLVFYTMGGYSGHGKYIAQELTKMRDDLDIVWIINDLKILKDSTLQMQNGIRFVYINNKKQYVHEMKTARIWIYDDMVPFYIQKELEQIYVQIKHWPSVTLKTFGFDLTTFRNEEAEVAVCKHNSEMMDYIITGSRFDTDTCRSGFGFQGEVIEAGSPRSDTLFNENKHRQKICEYFNLGYDRKIVLYAPTFRAKQGVYYTPEAYETDLDYEALVKHLHKRFSNEWTVLLRLHPVVAEASENIKLSEFVVDVSDYPDSQELVAAADIMITDYSSIMFEPAFVRKPVFLFAPDRKDYINGERKLLINYDTLPFPIAEQNEKLAEQIELYDEEEYTAQVDKFMEIYGVHEDGHASERAAQFISELIDGTRS